MCHTAEGTSAITPADEFHYLQPCQEGHAPAITSVEPSSDPAGTSVTIKGERFFTVVCTSEGFHVERVLFGLTEASFKSGPKEGEIVAVAPPGTGTVDVTVESGLGQSPVTTSDRSTYAQPTATQHWYKSGIIAPAGEEIPVVTFGKEANLAHMSGLGEINCKGVGGGVIDNPVGGGAGEGKTNSYSFYECKAEACEREIQAKFGVPGRGTVAIENNPASTKEPAFPGWTNLLEEATVAGTSSVREKIGEPFVTFKDPSPPGMIRETIDCTIAPTGAVAEEAIEEGELKPEIGVAKSANLNGNGASKPSKVKFNGSKLVEKYGEDWWNGVLKYLGYNEQELITVKP